MTIQSTENGSKILEFEAPCTENYKLSLEGLSQPLFTQLHIAVGPHFALYCILR